MTGATPAWWRSRSRYRRASPTRALMGTAPRGAGGNPGRSDRGGLRRGGERRTTWRGSWRDRPRRPGRCPADPGRRSDDAVRTGCARAHLRNGREPSRRTLAQRADGSRGSGDERCDGFTGYRGVVRSVGPRTPFYRRGHEGDAPTRIEEVVDGLGHPLPVHAVEGLTRGDEAERAEAEVRKLLEETPHSPDSVRRRARE